MNLSLRETPPSLMVEPWGIIPIEVGLCEFGLRPNDALRRGQSGNVDG